MPISRPARGMAADPRPTFVKIVTYNSTAWSSAKRFIHTAPHGATVILIQEHHLVATHTIAAEQASLAAAGWRSFFAPAIQRPNATSEAHSSGGVAIIVREELAAQDPAIIVEGRALSVTISAGPGAKAPIKFISAYFHAGLGIQDANKELASDLGAHLDQHSGPWVIGADWQATAEEVLSTRLPTRMGGRLITPPENQRHLPRGDGGFPANRFLFSISRDLRNNRQRHRYHSAEGEPAPTSYPHHEGSN